MTSPDPVERLREAVAGPLRDWEPQEHVVRQQVDSVLAAIVEELGVTEAMVNRVYDAAAIVGNTGMFNMSSDAQKVAYAALTLLRASRTEDAPHAD